MHLAIVLNDVGHYHHARLEAAGGQLGVAVTCIEVTRQSGFAEFNRAPGIEKNYRRACLFGDNEVSTNRLLNCRLRRALEALVPSVIAVPGWSCAAAAISLKWAADNRVPVVMMSESSALDGPSNWFKEQIKRRIVGLCSSAIVGGKPHARYIERLGMPSPSVFTGYDVIDNRHFSEGADQSRLLRQSRALELGLPARYFLACARLVPQKNLKTLIRSYTGYCASVAGERRHLVILGGGPLESELRDLAMQLGVADLVHFLGFKAYQMLPVYYGLADAFVHLSTVEPWGLVVNEAMAAGLPVLVSDRCGCADDLLVDGFNGYLVNPLDEEMIAHRMVEISQDSAHAERMGQRSREIIAGWDASRFGDAIRMAAESAAQAERRPVTLLSQSILVALRV